MVSSLASIRALKHSILCGVSRLWKLHRLSWRSEGRWMRVMLRAAIGTDPPPALPQSRVQDHKRYSASTHGAALNAESARDHLGNVKLIRLGDEDRDSLSFEARHDLAKPERKCGREALERLVEQQHASARHEGARERDHFLLASR